MPLLPVPPGRDPNAPPEFRARPLWLDVLDTMTRLFGGPESIMGAGNPIGGLMSKGALTQEFGPEVVGALREIVKRVQGIGTSSSKYAGLEPSVRESLLNFLRGSGAAPGVNASRVITDPQISSLTGRQFRTSMPFGEPELEVVASLLGKLPHKVQQSTMDFWGPANVAHYLLDSTKLAGETPRGYMRYGEQGGFTPGNATLSAINELLRMFSESQ